MRGFSKLEENLKSIHLIFIKELQNWKSIQQISSKHCKWLSVIEANERFWTCLQVDTQLLGFFPKLWRTSALHIIMVHFDKWNETVSTKIYHHVSIFKTFCDFTIGWIMHIGVPFLYLFLKTILWWFLKTILWWFLKIGKCSNNRWSVQTIGEVFKQ